MSDHKFSTAVLHCDRRQPDQYRAVHRPLYTTVAYAYSDPEDLIKAFQGIKPGLVYGRQGNPTTNALEAKLNLMEQGVATVCFSTGMAALSATFLALLQAGDHIVASAFLFGNTNSLFSTLGSLGIEVTFVDATDSANVEVALRPTTRMVFVETIANPCTQVTDLEGIGSLCAERGVLFVVDNTMTSPYLFRPAQVKAGLIVNSLSKYIGGHGNALGGSVTDTGIFNWQTFPNIYEAYRVADVRQWGILQIKKKGLRDMGATLDAESAHRLAMGAETLALRMDRICANALTLARYFSNHRAIKRVYYPGLEEHAQHPRSRRLFKGFGGMMAIEVADAGDFLGFLKKLNVIICSSHLGDNRTLAIPVAQTIFWEMGPARRESMGISDRLIRISVGIEDVEDLVADCEQALLLPGCN